MPAIMALQLSNVAGMARSYDIIELSRLKWEAQNTEAAFHPSAAFIMRHSYRWIGLV